MTSDPLSDNIKFELHDFYNSLSINSCFSALI